MNRIARIIGISFVMIGLLSGYFVHQTVNNFVLVTGAINSIGPWNVLVTDVRIPLIEDTQHDVVCEIELNISNPSRLPILIKSISLNLYNDDLSDSRSFVEKKDEIFVRTGSYSSLDGDEIAPAASRKFAVQVLVPAGSTYLERLMKRDSEGFYHPVIVGSFVFELRDFDYSDRIRGVYFSPPGGVPPYEG